MGTINMSAVAVCRAALITGLTFIAWNSSIDAQVQSCWSWLAAQRLVQHDTFEPAVVAVSFLVWHAVFWAMDGCSSLKPWRISASQDMRHWKYASEMLYVAKSKVQVLVAEVRCSRPEGDLMRYQTAVWCAQVIFVVWRVLPVLLTMLVLQLLPPNFPL